MTIRVLVAGDAEIARRPAGTEAMVKTHVSSIRRTFGVRERSQAVVLAYDRGVVQARPSV